MIRAFRLSVALSLCLTSLTSCSPTMPPKCQPSNCSGCCTEEGECVGVTKQNRAGCGTAGAACKACLIDQVCNSSGRCVANPDGGVSTGGGSAGGGDPGGGSSGTGGGTVSCGGQGEPCCAGNQCNLSLGCNRGLCSQCGNTGQPCCGVACQGSNICQGGTCVFPSTGGGSATGGGTPTSGGTAASGGTAQGGGSPTGGGTVTAGGTASGGGTALLGVGAACSVPSECADGQCLGVPFDSGYCSKSCIDDTECPPGSHCGRNPSGGNVCLKRCSPAGTVGAAGNCRPNYVCDRGGTSQLNVPVCFPACTAVSQCGPGATQCDGRGFCCGVFPYACCNNTQCDPGFACTNGYCTPSGAGGGSSGTGGGSSGTGGGSSGTGGGTSGTGGGTSGTGGGTVGGLPVGAACTSQSQCGGSAANRRCNPSWTGRPPWPGGYCSINCTTESCPSGSSCTEWAGLPNHCLANCNYGAATTGCRAGYVCERGLLNNFLQGTCYPACTSNSQCGSGRCDTATGYCCGNQGFKCCTSGAACNGTLTCQPSLGNYCG